MQPKKQTDLLPAKGSLAPERVKLGLCTPDQSQPLLLDIDI